MPRREFVADVAALTDESSPPGIQMCRAGEDDGTLVMQFSNGIETVDLAALIPEVSDYPHDHTWFIYTTSEEASTLVNVVLDEGDFGNLSVSQMLARLAKLLFKTYQNDICVEDDEADTRVDDTASSIHDVAMDDYSDDEIYFGDGIQKPVIPVDVADLGRPDGRPTMEQRRELAQKITQDLLLAKEAGFRISTVGTPFDGGPCTILISCPVQELGIQRDTLSAWHIEMGNYVTLAIRYVQGYVTLDEALAKKHRTIHMRLIETSHYRISATQATALFDTSAAQTKDVFDSDNGSTEIKPLFIDTPLNSFIDERFLLLVRSRLRNDNGLALSWYGAEVRYNQSLGMMTDSVNFKASTSEPTPSALPHIVLADHLAEGNTKHSLPLAAMHFALRHLVRCVEFCQVCHARMDTSFEALKPFVCSKPLCLYQYMQLGLGPTIENEIMNTPYVVDLLVSFCYVAGIGCCLERNLPVGLQLAVPPPYRTIKSYLALPFVRANTTDPKCFFGKMYHSDGAIVDLKQSWKPVDQRDPLPRQGEWVHVSSLVGAGDIDAHARVEEVREDAIVIGKLLPSRPHERPERIEGQTASRMVHKFSTIAVTVWDQNFDEMEVKDQCSTIVTLLNLLPPVQKLRAYLINRNGQTGVLSRWKSLPPATLSVLRWIIASNRSCLVPVDGIGEQRPCEPSIEGLLQGFVLFRFAQGAPDKEQRFVDAVEAAVARHRPAHPTIFAWHGSHLQNWHSIIRDGLNFNKIAHGRAYGNGIYHSLNMHESLGYSKTDVSPANIPGNGNQPNAEHWPASALKPEAALCLNEIVCAPQEFRATKPHLVVQYVDWTQTRYLAIKCKIHPGSINRQRPTEVLKFAKEFRTMCYEPVANPSGAGAAPLVKDSMYQKGGLGIPSTAVPPMRRAMFAKMKWPAERSATYQAASNGVATGSTNQAATCGDEQVDNADSDVRSVESEGSDRALYTFSLHKFEEEGQDGKGRPGTEEQLQVTRFTLGHLNPDSLPLLTSPHYATSQASNALQRELRDMRRIQERTKLHDLGWRIDTSNMENLYHWIVELHSFSLDTPLGQDMEELNCMSIVLEIRFGPSFPYSPPFVRVVRPQFLSFAAGGGGHVTAGGAMCMELLTNSGWNPACTMEAVLLQIRIALLNPEPRPARLYRPDNPSAIVGDYGMSEAVEAFLRACKAHHWAPSKDIADLQRMG